MNRQRIGALVAAALLMCGCGTSRRSGASLPDVTLPAVAGDALALSALEGPAVLNLWATWCAPCRTELPLLQREFERLGDEVEFVGVNIGGDTDTVAGFVTDVGVEFAQYLDSDGELSTALGVAGLPGTVFVSADGAFEVHQGALSGGELADRIDALIAEGR